MTTSPDCRRHMHTLNGSELCVCVRVCVYVCVRVCVSVQEEGKNACITAELQLAISCVSDVSWQMCDSLAMLQLQCIDMCFSCDLPNTLCLPWTIV